MTFLNSFSVFSVFRGCNISWRSRRHTASTTEYTEHTE